MQLSVRRSVLDAVVERVAARNCARACIEELRDPLQVVLGRHSNFSLCELAADAIARKDAKLSAAGNRAAV